MMSSDGAPRAKVISCAASIALKITEAAACPRCPPTARLASQPMASPGASAAVSWHPGRGRPIVDTGRLEASVRALDPGSRALLDLSLRRRVRDEAMAPHLR